MDKKRQSILRESRMPLQDMVLPDFPDDDTGTVTVTKSRRVSFGANFVKEFLGSAVSTEFFSEYEQFVPSSDSSNPNSSRSGFLDQSTFQQEDEVLDLCVSKSVINDENKYYPQNKRSKFCDENWDFNVDSNPNVFNDKKSAKGELKNFSNSRKPAPLTEWPSLSEKTPSSKKSDLDSTLQKYNVTNEKKSKQGKFSSTICFSADSPTADMEFTEGCISLAKSIFDKKKKEMTVYIQGKPKESETESKIELTDTILFESSEMKLNLTKSGDDKAEEMILSKSMEDNSDMTKCFGDFTNADMALTKCAGFDEDMESNDEDEPDPFSPATSMDISDDEESGEGSRKQPLFYALNALDGGVDDEDDADIKGHTFFAKGSLSDILDSGSPTTRFVLPDNDDDDDDEECGMDMTDVAKSSIKMVVEGDISNMKESDSVQSKSVIIEKIEEEIVVRKSFIIAQAAKEPGVAKDEGGITQRDFEMNLNLSPATVDNAECEPLEKSLTLESHSAVSPSRDVVTPEGTRQDVVEESLKCSLPKEDITLEKIGKEKGNIEGRDICSLASKSLSLCDEGAKEKERFFKESNTYLVPVESSSAIDKKKDEESNSAVESLPDFQKQKDKEEGCNTSLPEGKVSSTTNEIKENISKGSETYLVSNNSLSNADERNEKEDFAVGSNTYLVSADGSSIAEDVGKKATEGSNTFIVPRDSLSYPDEKKDEEKGSDTYLLPKAEVSSTDERTEEGNLVKESNTFLISSGRLSIADEMKEKEEFVEEPNTNPAPMESFPVAEEVCEKSTNVSVDQGVVPTNNPSLIDEKKEKDFPEDFRSDLIPKNNILFAEEDMQEKKAEECSFDLPIPNRSVESEIVKESYVSPADSRSVLEESQNKGKELVEMCSANLPMEVEPIADECIQTKKAEDSNLEDLVVHRERFMEEFDEESNLNLPSFDDLDTSYEAMEEESKKKPVEKLTLSATEYPPDEGVKIEESFQLSKEPNSVFAEEDMQGKKAEECSLDLPNSVLTTSIENEKMEECSLDISPVEDSDITDERVGEESEPKKSVPETTPETYDISSGDKKIMNLLAEQAQETNCCWRICGFKYDGGTAHWSIYFSLWDRTGIMSFGLAVSKDVSLVSFSTVTARSITLLEPSTYRPKKEETAVAFAFEKLRNQFEQDSKSVDTVYKLPIFLDKMNLHLLKMERFVSQVIRITKEYPGSRLSDSVLSFRLYSFPMLLSFNVLVDVSDPFRLTADCVTVEKHFGRFSEKLIKSTFADCLRSEDALTQFVITLTQRIIQKERKMGRVTNRSHIRLIS